MPSDEALLQQAEEAKTQGNEAFQNGQSTQALQFYSQGIVACDRLPQPPVLLGTLLANRAMASLKLLQFQACIDDCTRALQLPNLDSTKLRPKLAFRRAKARILSKDGAAAEEAAKDLRLVLQADPTNVEAKQLLHVLRAQQSSTTTSPLGKVMESLQSEPTTRSLQQLLALLNDDPHGASMELGRQYMDTLLGLIDHHPTLQTLALQCLAQAGTHPLFARQYLVPLQSKSWTLVTPEAHVANLALCLRVLLHADRDASDGPVVGTTLVDYTAVLRVCHEGLATGHPSVLRAVLDVLTTWTSGTERDALIRNALSGYSDPLLETPKTPAEIRALTPQELAAYRQRQHELTVRNQAWAYERSRLFLEQELQHYMTTALSMEHHVLRRELQVVLGRLCVAIDSDDELKGLLGKYLSSSSNAAELPQIEEVSNEDDDNEAKHEEETTPLETKMQRAFITAALLLAKKDVGAWALQFGWNNSADELPDLIASGNPIAMCLASEVLSAAATVQAVRPLVANLTSSGSMEKLLMCDDRDIRSGAASAVAKLGLSERADDEGEVMGLLQAACDLLEDRGDESELPTTEESKLRHFNSFATSSVERAIEMITYLVAHTIVKDELAAGFHSRPDGTALELLVKTADLPSAGESLSGFGLATIFQHMAVTNLQIRKEGFEGKEVTMEQYDEMQKMGKTEEEKEVMDAQKDPDTQAACDERIRKMANANVPRALVTLMEGASEHTLEQVVQALDRIAGEPSVRGLMIQQGVLSACIKVEKNEGPTETDVMKKVIRLARHTIAKMLVTTNPSLLTSAQRLGSVRPLIQLIRDNKASDLQHFEALLSLTNVASSGEDAKNRIVAEKGIGSLHFAMFSDHEMVRRAATEAMCNLVPHEGMMNHLKEEDNLRLWLAFAADHEENYECARAAAGCLAMATQDEEVAIQLVALEKFRESATGMLESGRLEIMHRVLVILLNLAMHGDECLDRLKTESLVAFCEAYISSYQSGEVNSIEFPESEKALLPVTVDLAKKIVKAASD